MSRHGRRTKPRYHHRRAVLEWPIDAPWQRSPHERLTGGRPLSCAKLSQGTYQQIMHELGSRPPEAAGVLLGPRHDESLATHFVLDDAGCSTDVSFTLSPEFLNPLLAQYRQCDLTCVGIVHSHPTGITNPSHGDLVYLASLFGRSANQDVQAFLFPIYCDGRLHPYLIRPGRDLPVCQPAALVLV